MELDANKKQLFSDAVQRIKTAQQITDKLATFCKDTIVSSLTYKKFDIDKGVEAYLALLTEKSLLNDRALRIIYYYKLAKKDLKLKTAKLSDIFQEYVETLVMLQGSIVTLNKILNNPQVRKYANDLDFVINYFRRISNGVAEFTDSEDPEVAAIFGADEDDGIINVGGFCETEVVTYPIGGVSVNPDQIPVYSLQVLPHLTVLVERLSQYLEKRDPEYKPLFNSTEPILQLRMLLMDLLKQDQTVFQNKITQRCDTTKTATMDADSLIADYYSDLLSLGINPYARSELLKGILAAYGKLTVLSGAKTDDDFKTGYEALNTFGFSLEQLLSPENKATCVNNIAYYLGFIVLAQKNYLSTRDDRLKQAVNDIMTQHPDLRVGALYNPATDSADVQLILQKTNVLLPPSKFKYFIS